MLTQPLLPAAKTTALVNLIDTLSAIKEKLVATFQRKQCWCLLSHCSGCQPDPMQLKLRPAMRAFTCVKLSVGDAKMHSLFKCAKSLWLEANASAYIDLAVRIHLESIEQTDCSDVCSRQMNGPSRRTDLTTTYLFTEYYAWLYQIINKGNKTCLQVDLIEDPMKYGAAPKKEFVTQRLVY